MNKLKKFIDVIVPVTTCTLRCHYCYITHRRLFGGALPHFKYSPEQFKAALTQKRLGGVCMFNFCGGGETLLPPEILEYIYAILEEGHYVMIVTNATVDRAFDTMEKWPKEFLSRLFFKFSYHYLELKKRNLFDKFFRNIRRMRDAGASFTLEATPSDELVPYIDEMKEQSMREVGAWCHISVPRYEHDFAEIPLLSRMSPNDFYNTWKVFDSAFFEYKFSVFGEKQTKFCYAGDWTGFLVMGEESCRFTQCYCSLDSMDLFDDLDKPVKCHAVGHFCQLPHCFNAHAFLSFGAIPERNDPTYDVLRNRVCADGSEWLKPRMKEFMHQRLRDNNAEYSMLQKFLADSWMEVHVTERNIKKDLRKVVKKLLPGKRTAQNKN